MEAAFLNPAINILLGSLLVLASAIDAIQTTVGTSRGGFITYHFNKHLWKFQKLLFLRLKKGRKLLVIGGTINVFTTLWFWLGLSWAGWFLIYSASLSAVVFSSEPFYAVTWLDRLYFIGMALATLGTGDIKAGSSSWRLLSAFIAFNGFFLATLGLSYVFSLVSAALERRKLAFLINNLGSSPSEMLRPYLNAKDFSYLMKRFNSFFSELERFAQQQISYPSLRFMQRTDDKYAPSLSIGRLLVCAYYLKANEELLAFEERRTVEDLVEVLRELLNTVVENKHNLATPRLPELPTGSNIHSSLNSIELNQQTKSDLLLAGQYIYDEGWNWDQALNN